MGPSANASFFPHPALKSSDEWMTRLPMSVQSLLTLYTCRPTHVSEKGDVTCYHEGESRFVRLDATHTIETWAKQLADPMAQESPLFKPQLWAAEIRRTLQHNSIFARDLCTDTLIDIRPPVKYVKQA